ncbi:capsule polysaccharide synthase [Grosmannia clavigera kw1407]|uniref:Peroxidase n=1 Tax=Grosmannia clavigera (strain kw1407 / UAMH 11150) TaxID=655863 RepID=F0XJU8_GROCL|nr:capsule polysaccharide synthase [Grosmannia clavigera kw1407]EFX02320.1 capsule polysaccharide synthase [Grosmannia clavigera kw1407]
MGADMRNLYSQDWLDKARSGKDQIEPAGLTVMDSQFLAACLVNKWTTVFIALFIWRYLRQVVHLVSFWRYRPAKISDDPSFTARDVTIILPTVDPTNGLFTECLLTIIENAPSRVIVVTAGEALRLQTGLDTTIDVIAAMEANKRQQVAYALQLVTTAIVALVDDHVMWTDKFLTFALPAFDDRRVGLVGTNKRVLRETHHSSLAHRILNMIQCLYLERHNFEIRSTNAVDGGVFVVSGRTCLVRSEVVVGTDFVEKYTNDYCFFGLIGPLGADDDNFLTRWCVAHGWKIRIQYCPETLVTTTLGSSFKFAGGLRRWVRTTWRSNAISLVHVHVWRAQPWCVYAVYLTSFTNFALFYDIALIYALARSGFVDGHSCGAFAFVPVVFWMVLFKMVKPFAYFWRHPEDVILIPAYFLFTWAHSFIKLISTMKPGPALAIILLGGASNIADAFPASHHQQSNATQRRYLHGLTRMAQSTVLLGDLAIDGATTESGQAIQAILQGTASARVENEETYRQPLGGPHVKACHENTCCVWSHIVAQMTATFRSADGRHCTALARSAIRMGYHDAGAWNTSMPRLSAEAVAHGIGGGGADGSILLSDGELNRTENRGLQDIAHLVMSWYNVYHWSHGVSAADLIQMGALVATTACPGGPRIRAFVGRHDVEPGSPPPPHGLLPPSSSDAPWMLYVFKAKTLSPADLVALVGAHTVSRQFFVDTMYAGQAQDSTPAVFDTRFFDETTAAEKSPPGVYSFHSDMSLAADPTTQPIWASFTGENVHGS